MEIFFKSLLALHIAAGAVSLLTGPASMLNRKGGKWHRLTGKVFFYAMLVVAFTAVTMASLPNHHSPFLLIIGVFSAYLVSSGYRVLHLKGLATGQKPKLLDWAIAMVMAAFALYFVGMGLKSLGNNGGVVSVVFGSIALGLVAKDVRKYTQAPTDKKFWLYDHITRMVAGNIAAYTAFLVVNNAVLPQLVAWLGPTVIGSLVISYFIKKYKRKPKAGETTKELEYFG
ncbi:DUF2306 domain-containing protein [Pontibacter qinzhouensis]|uniref:DUF2306 domain-containing protein n=1 Tax=Pontibacter qinzhouensis TaxID=2603253 RepID=A0A5C8KFZ7_9BACT|nr:DUF2306 domain-containing protein [Pontibacter qinzhouensis]TXK52830.1 DUF2306 domain-containing protein [Pontibacter qinzhouensis]